MKVIEIDATNQSLGRMATKIAMVLRGKDAASWTPNIIPDIQVVVHNLDKIIFKGTKAASKVYYTHSGFPGGMKERTLEEAWSRDKNQVLRKVVRGMLPENRQRDILLNHIVIK
ncbi:MAG: 50S ribosomal protein L13 [Candidatus Pacebacteria bacterium]|nr:50S ribosomal protein L13 [Candidatus Paceibacterota bacterium]